MPLYVDGGERTCRTKVFAGTAANATLGIDGRYLRRIGIINIREHHLYSAGRTVAGTVATIHTIRQWYTILLYPHSMTYLDGRFISHRDGLYGACRTNFGTLHTFRTAIAALVGHLGLHQGHKAGGRTQHLVRAHRHAKLASRAMLRKVAGTH